MTEREDIAFRLRQVAQAYPESVFPEFSPEELEKHSGLISRASGNMGRFLGRHMIDGADEIDRLRALATFVHRWVEDDKTSPSEIVSIIRNSPHLRRALRGHP